METGEGLLLRWTAGGVGWEAASLDALLACPRYWGVSSRGHAMDVGGDVLHGCVRCATGLGSGGRRRHAAVHGGGWYGLHAVHTGVHHVAAKLLSLRTELHAAASEGKAIARTIWAAAMAIIWGTPTGGGGAWLVSMMGMTPKAPPLLASKAGSFWLWHSLQEYLTRWCRQMALPPHSLQIDRLLL